MQNNCRSYLYAHFWTFLTMIYIVHDFAGSTIPLLHLIMKWPFLSNQGRSAPTQDGGNLVTCNSDNILTHRSTRGLVHTTDRVIVYDN